MSGNTDLITIETYIKQRRQLIKQFFIYGPECECLYIFGYLGGGGGCGGLQLSDWDYIAFQLSSHPYLCTCQIIRKQSDRNVLV